MYESHEMTLSNGAKVLLVPVYGRVPDSRDILLSTEGLMYWEARQSMVVGYGVGISEALVDLRRQWRHTP